MVLRENNIGKNTPQRLSKKRSLENINFEKMIKIFANVLRF